MCGPLARCSRTGEQCISDQDCYGCKIPQHKQDDYYSLPGLIGDDDSGKSTGTIPEYSSLTSNFSNNYETLKPKKLLQLSYNVNLWKKHYNQGMQLFNKRYKKPGFMEYKPRPTLSGEFEDDGAFASNA